MFKIDYLCVMTVIKDVTSVLKTGESIADTVSYSGEERAKDLNTRHETDMTSDSWLSKNIRPITLLFLLLCQGAIVVGMLCGLPTNVAIVSQVGTLLFGAFGFYFNSKKGERIAQHNAKANIEITKMQMKAEEKRERAARRLERIKARRN